MKIWWLCFLLCLRLVGWAQNNVNKLTKSGKVSLVIPCIVESHPSIHIYSSKTWNISKKLWTQLLAITSALPLLWEILAYWTVVSCSNTIVLIFLSVNISLSSLWPWAIIFSFPDLSSLLATPPIIKLVIIFSFSCWKHKKTWVRNKIGAIYSLRYMYVISSGRLTHSLQKFCKVAMVGALKLTRGHFGLHVATSELFIIFIITRELKFY